MQLVNSKGFGAAVVAMACLPTVLLWGLWRQSASEQVSEMERPELPVDGSRHFGETWWKAHERNQASGQRFQCDASKPPLVFLGDSILESLLGTELGRAVPRTQGVAEVLKIYERHWRPLVLAIAGDQTQHLLYRMPKELPGCLQSSSKSTFLVLIGTNNLGAGFSVEQTVKGIMAVAEWLLENTQGRLIFLHLLPRNKPSRHGQLQSKVAAVNGAMDVELALRNASGRLEVNRCG
ncbi:unnamed protein product, partial [Durusdinium trenchii]